MRRLLPLCFHFNRNITTSRSVPLAQRAFAIAATMFFILGLAAVANGQGFGKIVGTVRDPSGAVITNATVTAREVGKGFSRTATTDDTGYFVLDSLRPAQYDLSVEAQGFHTFDQKGITLLADQTLTANATMQVGAVSESVSITSGGEQVDTSTSTLKQVIEQKSIQELPLNGRNAAELSLLVAGTTSYPTNPANPTGTFAGGALQGATKTFPGAVAIVTNGSRQNQVSYQLDGGNNVDEYTNVNQPFPMPDALQEFSVQTSNYSAQYGQNAGGVVNVITKSGTNQFHGNAFEFLRNKALNARPWHAPTKDLLKRNQFGGTFGGPIIRNKTFFFAGYQQTIQRNQLAGQNATVPSAAARATATDPAVISLLSHIPIGTPTSNANLNRASFFRPDQQDFREFTARVDHSFSSKDQLTFRYFYDHFERNAVFDPANLLIYSDGSTIKSQNYLGHWTHVFKPEVINDFRFSYAPENATRGPADNAFDVTEFGVKLPFQAEKKAIQQVRINGVFNFGDNPQASFIRNNLTWADDVSWVAGKHELRFGGVVERSKVDLLNGFFQPAEFSFPSLAAFLGGKLGDYSGNLAFRQGAGEFKNNRNTFFGIYIQDNFRVSRRLMLNLGLRWEPALPWREIKGRQEQFRLQDLIAGVRSKQFPNAPPGVFFPGDAGVPENGVRANYTSFAPRVGFAYDVFGDSKTSIRGGFGIFYDTRIPGVINNRFADLTPFSPQFVLNTGVVNPGTFSDPLCTLAATQALQGCTNQAANYPFPFTYPPASNIQFGLGVFVLSWDPVNKYQPPTIDNWNLAIERQLPENILIRAAYVGSHSTHLTEALNLNPRPVGTTS
ncbi:MAG: TonB-dependent receptor, partial [Blastocatellia bacterium]